MPNRSDDSSTVLFRCHFSRTIACLILLVGAVFSLIMLDTLFFHQVLPAKRGMGYQILFGVILLMGFLIVWVGLLQIRNPPVFFDVTRRGIANYQSPTGTVTEPCVLPWERVESMELVRRAISSSSHQNQWCWFIKTVVTVDDDWPPDGFFGYDGKEHAVFLDAFSGTPSGKKLLNQLIVAYEQSGHSASR